MAKALIYCPRRSDGARLLIPYLAGLGIRTMRVREGLRTKKGNFVAQRGDLFVPWGSKLTEEELARLEGLGVRVLNGKAPIGNKMIELSKMAEAEVRVPAMSRQPREGWYARRIHHQEANDLLAELRVGDYYVEPIPAVNELRVHVFKGVAVRSGVKFRRPEHPNPHPIFRSWNAGWGLTYDQARVDEVIRQTHRDLAKKACEALGYDFGAVDIGVLEDRTGVVFEVNSAPGLEGNTLNKYGDKLAAVLRG